MTSEQREKIEELHGLWELAVMRLAALAEAEAGPAKIADAVVNERVAFNRWQAVSEKVCAS